MNHVNDFPFERNRYFYGKLLTVRDFEVEQRYHCSKRALLNRLLHGSGVVCGLGVTASDESTLMIESGMALDYQGREIVLPETLFRKLQMLEGQETLAGKKDAYLCLSYAQEDVEPVNATYEQAVLAYANGARSMTHVYNGMSPFNHRANGLVGAAFRIRTMYGEIICDGCHSTPAALNAYFMSKGPDFAIMVSDALMAKGTPVGSKYLFGGNEIVIYPDGSAHLTSTGGLAGSTLNINKGLKILVEEAMVPFNYALNACTINPARCLHLDDRKGSLQAGKDADIVVLEDNYDVLQTYCKGQPKL